VKALSRGRRLALAMLSLTCAAVLFHTNVATALVSRGDDLLAAGDVNGAARVYGRAFRLDAANADAADRLAFALLLRRAPGDAARADAVAVAGLAAAPHDARLLADRGFAAQRLRRWRDAEAAFLGAALVGRDPRYAHLAAQMARRCADRAAERMHLRTALALDRRYAPARMLLARWNR
jgi:hypothetical protein